MPMSDRSLSAPRLSKLSGTLRGSAILNIAGEVRALKQSGRELLDLTVGDFSSKQFRIPRELEDGIVDALRAGESTYPPPIGLDSLRAAVRELYLRRLGLDYPIESILICSGARPAIYATYRALVDPGERVVFGVPSWNNDAYTEMMVSDAVTFECDASTRFLPTAKQLRPLVRDARLIALNSPLNPTGTLFDAQQLGDICDLVLEENARRGSSERPLFVMYDQVYWMLTSGGARHVDPVSLRPEMAPYVVLVDAISKAFAATGLRVGWAVAPAEIIRPMSAILTHVGAWAPRPEQVASAKLLSDHAVVDAYIENMRRETGVRLDAVYNGLMAMQRDGLPVECVKPEAAIYVSARFALHGMRTPDGTVIESDEDTRRYLLNTVGLAAIPFNAFGSQSDAGWFRLSIGVVSVAQIEAVLPVLRRAIEALEPVLASR
jgi:Aspartate/tyrosine/aromatic aminotransferase